VLQNSDERGGAHKCCWYSVTSFLCVALCCFVSQCAAVHCSVLHYLAEQGGDHRRCIYIVLQSVALICSVLQCVAVYCSELQYPSEQDGAHRRC